MNALEQMQVDRNYWRAKAEGEHLAFVAVQEENERQHSEIHILNKQIKGLRGAVGLLNCMVYCGEKHSERSETIVTQALGQRVMPVAINPAGN